MSLEEMCFKYIVRHLGRLPCDALRRLPNSIRYRLLQCMPAAMIWRMETTSFVQGLDMEVIWSRLFEERVLPHSNFYNRRWSCSKGTEFCLNSSHDRGTMSSIGFPFVFHDCVVHVSNCCPSAESNLINQHRLSSRSLYFLCLWKMLYSANSFTENQNVLSDMLFLPLSPSETGLPESMLLSTPASHCLLFDILHVPLELVLPQQIPLLNSNSSSPTTYIGYVNTLTSFLALECHVRPTYLYINPSYSFLNQQSANVLHELMCNIDTFSFEYSSVYRCVLDAVLRNPDLPLLLAIRGKGAARDLIHCALNHKKFSLEFSFSGRSSSEPELSSLATNLSQHITSFDITFHSSPEASHNLACQCIALTRKSHIRRLSLNGVLNAFYAKAAVAAYLTAPCCASQILELKKIYSATANEITVGSSEPTVHHSNSDYWKYKSLFISSESGEFSSWVLGLSHYRMFSLELIDYTANFDCTELCEPIQVQTFHLSIMAAYKTIDSFVLTKILMTVASVTLQYVNLDLHCKISSGTSSLIRSLTLFLKEQSKVGALLKFHIHIHSFDDIDCGDLVTFFEILFNLPFVATLNFKLDCRNCGCDHAFVLVALQRIQLQSGMSYPAHFYFRTSGIEWKEVPNTSTFHIHSKVCTVTED